MGRATSEAKSASSKANGAAPVKPGSRPRGRPRKNAEAQPIEILRGVQGIKHLFNSHLDREEVSAVVITRPKKSVEATKKAAKP